METAASSGVTVCPVCGAEEFTSVRILWPELIAEWELSPAEVDYVDLQQGFSCVACKNNLRSMTLAAAMTKAFRFSGNLSALCRTGAGIRSMRVVEIQGPQTGIGTFGGVAAGATAGSFIGGGDPRASIVGAIAGAIVGGIAGSAIERSASTGYAIDFIIREDDGQTTEVVQTNEEAFQPGERVVLVRGARTRLQRAAPGV